MRIAAAVLHEIGSPPPYAESRPLSVEEVVLDPPGAGELLVRIEAAGVCHSDLSVVDGNRPRPVPMVLGHEAAGVVEEVGAGVDDVTPGDHVVLTFVPACGRCSACAEGRPTLCARAALANTEGRMLGGGRRLHGTQGDLHHHLGVSGFAERAVVSRGSAVPVPTDIPFDVAALFGCAVLTGVGAILNTAAVRPGESVVVFGLGGVGLSAVLGACVAGAYPVVAVDPVATKRDLARALGADDAVAPADAEQAVLDRLGRGADHTVEAVGQAEVLATAYRLTRPGGTTVAVGLAHPEARVTIAPVSLVGEGRRLVGCYMGDAVPQRDIPRLITLLRAGRLPVDRLHSETLPLSEVNEAMDALAGGAVVRQILDPRATLEPRS